jgi:hypothetical protein
MKGKIHRDVTSSLHKTESYSVSETKDGFIITNPRVLILGETVSVLAIL